MSEWSNLLTSQFELVAVIAGTVFVIALTFSVIFTSFMSRLSHRWGAVDIPNGELKCHRHSTATLGGIPLFLSLTLALLWLVYMDSGLIGGLLHGTGGYEFTGSVLGAGLIILLLGAKDDIRHIMPLPKLTFQIVTALVFISLGLVVRRCGFFGVFEIPLGVLAVPFTLFWLVGSCNAFNFIDGMDGLASGIGTVIAVLLAVLGFITGQYVPALISLGLAGALLGVLLFNIKPAQIFLGDSGSQLTGLLLGALTIKIATVQGVFALPTAGLLLSVPVLDALLAILRRFSRHQSPAQGDRDHIHHCLRRHGLTVNQVSVTLWLTVLFAGGMGVVFFFTTGVSIGMAALALIGLHIYLGVRMGCLNTHKLWMRLVGDYQEPLTQFVNQVNTSSQGKTELDRLWERMKPLFEQMSLDRAILTLEGISPEGQPHFETYQWARSEKRMAELLVNHWTKRFALDEQQRRIATLRLESAQQLNRDEQRIDWLLQQIRENMQLVTQVKNQSNEEMKEEMKEEVKLEV